MYESTDNSNLWYASSPNMEQRMSQMPMDQPDPLSRSSQRISRAAMYPKTPDPRMSMLSQQRMSTIGDPQRASMTVMAQRMSVLSQVPVGEQQQSIPEEPVLSEKSSSSSTAAAGEGEEQQSEEASDASTPETSGPGSWGTPVTRDQYNRKAYRKFARLVKKRQNEIVVLTVFNSNGDIVCSQFGAQDGQQERTYIPNAAEGKYLLLALERGFKKEGCDFDFGEVLWLSGKQEEVDDKQTLLGTEYSEPFCHHRFYSVLSPTGRYVVAGVLKERPGGELDPKLMRKIRNMADKFEVYQDWSAGSKFFAKLACAA